MKYKIELRLVESDGNEDPHELKSVCINVHESSESSDMQTSLMKLGMLFTAYEYFLTKLAEGVAEKLDLNHG